MFKLQPNPTFTASVKLSQPGSDKPGVLEVEFKHLSRPEIKTYFGGLEGKTDGEALSEIIVGWKGVDAPYSAAALETLLDNYPAAAHELFSAYRQELLESRLKN